MTLKDIYQHFLDLPNPISLADNAALHYITTVTTFTQPGPIVRHLESQDRRVVKTRSIRIISAVEASNALALEVETVLEFISGGGSYLPGLENFIVDKIATIPTTHFVDFDAEQKISRIRISWDQASLLKQAEVIGSRGSNWPVFDGKDQIRLIKSGSNPAPVAAPQAQTSPRGRPGYQSIPSSRNVSPSKKHIKDPYASLDLFSPKPTEENEHPAVPNAVAPRASAKPPPREMSELFAAGHEDHEPGSPKKAPADTVIAPKGGGNQKFAPPRLFEDDIDEPSAVRYKSNPAKYNHFDLGDAVEDDPMQHRENTSQLKTAIPMRAKTNKNQSQWNFEDFTTPVKVAQKIRGQDVLHFSLEDDAHNFDAPARNFVGQQRRNNDAHFEMQDDGTPIERHVVPKPRKDAETHFQIKDTSTPAPVRTSTRPRSSADNRQSLYTNNLYGEADDDRPQGKAPLSTITSNTNRKNDFDSHWNMAEVSPAPEKASNENKPVGDNHHKAVENMGSHWDTYDQSPDQVKEPSHSRLRKGMESHWTFGEEEPSTTTNGTSKPQKSFWDF
ncbi:hypothetical protein A1O3_09264 [Capronia epimyces CBS 606.96]|uniref:Uncharacterized protein n=1 Tax=Capronia epimyces CBS 606.96 TaxID=1182542 RepID=W9XD15_9EURO|nr:uncharacterized protein A1O3_09264 [Capronia epimyces CBS 606.96]EXJ78103.1 hypothetical protein A1O3_09264 [Capronia epimyces CBS 606.96]